MYSLQCFSSDRVLNNHKENCLHLNGAQGIEMPTEDNNILRFINYHRRLPVPFIIIADIEAVTEREHTCQIQPNADRSYKQAYQKHTDCGYAYKVVCCYDDQHTKPIQLYRGPDAVYKFMRKVLEEVKYCSKVRKDNFNEKLKMTEEDKEDFRRAGSCHICGKKYTEEEMND